MTGLRLGIAGVTALAMAALAAPGSGEVVQEDGVRVTVSGDFAPSELPRRGAAPISVSVSGRIKPVVRTTLPKLTEIEIALNSHGSLKTGSQPVCRLGKIDPSTTEEALAACRSSLVGQGRFSADVRVPEQSPYPSRGKVLVFNGKLRGKPALFAHVYGTEPVPSSIVLPFEIEKASGDFGTVLRASLPQVTGEWGYVTAVSFSLRRGFTAAGCPAPAGFRTVSFPLMRTRFGFSGGASLTSTLIRSCRAR